MFINDKHKFVYISATKSGSSSVSRRLQNQFGGKNLGNTVWKIPPGHEDYYTFIVVRNPYARMVSWWNSVCNIEGDRYGHKKELQDRGLTTSLADFLTLWDLKGDYSQYKYVEVNGGSVDKIIKLENIDEDFATLPFVKNAEPLPQINKKKYTPWEDAIDDRSIELINKIYNKDFEFFKYEKINISS